MKHKRKGRGALYHVVELIPIFVFLIPIGISLTTMSVIENNIVLPIVWRNIVGAAGCICMIASTIVSIVYRHAQGEVYNFRNASRSRVMGFAIFAILFTILVVYMVFSELSGIALAIGISIWFYLGGYLCFKYVRIKKYQRDYGMVAILILLSFSVMLILKCVQVWFDFGMKLNY